MAEAILYGNGIVSDLASSYSHHGPFVRTFDVHSDMGLIIAKSFLVMGYYTSLKGDDRPVAAVYRGPIACEGCAESVAHLLRRSPARFKVHYLGPEETHDISPQTLSHLDLFAWPGGGGECQYAIPDVEVLMLQR